MLSSVDFSQNPGDINCPQPSKLDHSSQRQTESPCIFDQPPAAVALPSKSKNPAQSIAEGKRGKYVQTWECVSKNIISRTEMY